MSPALLPVLPVRAPSGADPLPAPPPGCDPDEACEDTATRCDGCGVVLCSVHEDESNPPSPCWGVSGSLGWCFDCHRGCSSRNCYDYSMGG